jgi:hypothetical protein
MADGRVNEEEIGRTWVRLNGASEITPVVFGSEDATPLLGPTPWKASGSRPIPLASVSSTLRGC